MRDVKMNGLSVRAGKAAEGHHGAWIARALGREFRGKSATEAVDLAVAYAQDAASEISEMAPKVLHTLGLPAEEPEAERVKKVWAAAESQDAIAMRELRRLWVEMWSCRQDADEARARFEQLAGSCTTQLYAKEYQDHRRTARSPRL